LGNHDEAMSDNNKSIEIWERMKLMGKVINENDLAKAYLNGSINKYKLFFKNNEQQLKTDSKIKFFGNFLRARKKNK
jgi:hypothetical protein